MAWRSRRQEQEAVEGVVRMLIAGLIICAVLAAYSIGVMEERTGAKIEKTDGRALFQAANMRAAEVAP